MHLRVALLALSQAQSALPFVHPQAFRIGDADARAPPPSRSNPSVRMVASVPTSTVTTTHELNGDAGKGGRQATSPGALVADQPEGGLVRTVEMYDTTLRDGTQMEGVSASVLDKLKIALQLHHFGMHRMSACRVFCVSTGSNDCCCSQTTSLWIQRWLGEVACYAYVVVQQAAVGSPELNRQFFGDTFQQREHVSNTAAQAGEGSRQPATFVTLLDIPRSEIM